MFIACFVCLTRWPLPEIFTYWDATHAFLIFSIVLNQYLLCIIFIRFVTMVRTIALIVMLITSVRLCYINISHVLFLVGFVTTTRAITHCDADHASQIGISVWIQRWFITHQGQSRNPPCNFTLLTQSLFSLSPEQPGYYNTILYIVACMGTRVPLMHWWVCCWIVHTLFQIVTFLQPCCPLGIRHNRLTLYWFIFLYDIQEQIAHSSLLSQDKETSLTESFHQLLPASPDWRLAMLLRDYRLMKLAAARESSQ